MLSCFFQAPGYQYSFASHCKTMGNVNDVIVRSKGQDWVPGASIAIRFLRILMLLRRAVHNRSLRRLHRRRGLQVIRTTSLLSLPAIVERRFRPLNIPAAPRGRALCSLPLPALLTLTRRHPLWRLA
jgi:hypothetical protein